MALHPVGPLPASTYWRRRLVLLIALLAVALLARSCLGGGSAPPRPTGHDRPTPTVTQGATTPSPAGSPTPSPTTAAIGTCRDSELNLTSSTDARSYPVGTSPRFTLSIKNVSTRSCRRDLGGKAVEVLVYSASDRIWSNHDCGVHTDSSVQLLRPGATLQSTVTWSGKRSAPGCTGDRAQAKRGTYTLRARVGTLKAPYTVFGLRG